MSSEPGAVVSSPHLYEKLHEVAKAIDGIAKKGRNEHQGYDYVQASDVTLAIREQLLKRGVLMLASVIPGSITHQPATGGKGFVTTVEFEYRFVNVERPANPLTFTTAAQEIVVKWAGVGADIGGDKGIYKAMTGSLKYMFLTNFLIPMGNDPERDDTTGTGEEEHRDDARATVPSIPLDRARGILEQAILAGLAREAGEGTEFRVELVPVLKAKLAAVGVTTGKIAHLNVDQAEDVEAWIKAEASS